jgi:hypothetical protein
MFMKESWRRYSPSIGVAFGAAAGVLACAVTGNGLLIALGPGLGVVVGAVAAASLSTRLQSKKGDTRPPM